MSIKTSANMIFGEHVLTVLFSTTYCDWSDSWRRRTFSDWRNLWYSNRRMRWSTYKWWKLRGLRQFQVSSNWNQCKSSFYVPSNIFISTLSLTPTHVLMKQKRYHCQLVTATTFKIRDNNFTFVFGELLNYKKKYYILFVFTDFRERCNKDW